MKFFRLILLGFYLMFSIAGFCQLKWHNPLKEVEFVIQNQGFTSEIGHTFNRLPSRAQPVISSHLWSLSQDAAGLAIYFQTDAPELEIRYAIKGPLSMEHMPATGVSGIDLYQKDRQGGSHYCFGGYPSSKDTICYHYLNLSTKQTKNCYQLYLPLYNSLNWLEIGVPEKCFFSFIPASKKPPIVVYGTSIVQGGCTSRPGMSWTNILQRHLDYPVVNFGFSSNGRLDKTIITFINELHPAIVILDCLPNLTDLGSSELTNLIITSIKHLRESFSAMPIILVEHAGLSNSLSNDSQLKLCQRMNNASLQAYKKLKADGDKYLFYLSNKELSFTSDCFVDEVHYNDLGMTKYATAMEKKLSHIHWEKPMNK